MAKAAVARQDTVWIPTTKIIATFHPDNPRLHDTTDSGDVPYIARTSLLPHGWATNLTMQRDGNLLSGHGRALAAKWLTEQSEEYLDHLWELFLQRKPPKDVAEEAKPRYKPSYWDVCPVTIVNLDENAQKALMIRLNNTSRDGTDSPVKMAKVLATLPRAYVEDAAWEESSRKAFTAAYLNRVEKEPIEEEDEPLDFQAGQRFERGDATDYDSDDHDPEDDATLESGAVTSRYQDGEEGEQSDDDYEQAEVSVDIDDNFRHEGVNYDSSIRATRAVLLYDRKQLEEFKTLAKPLAFILKKLGYEIDDVTQGIKFWRPDAVLTAMQHLVYKQYPQWLAEYEATKTAKPESEDEEEEAA